MHNIPHHEVSVAAGQVSEYNLDGSERVEALLGSRFGGEWNEMLASRGVVPENDYPHRYVCMRACIHVSTIPE